jgi:hypothetical protein
VLESAEYRLSDPLVRATAAIADAVEEAVATVMVKGETSLAQKLQDTLMSKLQTLMLFAEDCQYVFTPSASGLGNLITHFDAFSADVEEVELILSKNDDEEVDLSVLTLMAPARLEFANLKKRMPTITERHITLQTHFEHLVTDAVTPDGRPMVTDSSILLTRLSELRDEYFVAPRRGLIGEYLEFAEATIAELEAKFGPRNFTGLEPLTVKLEVYSILETADSASASSYDE